jgi:hypothetical protein
MEPDVKTELQAKLRAGGLPTGGGAAELARLAEHGHGWTEPDGKAEGIGPASRQVARLAVQLSQTRTKAKVSELAMLITREHLGTLFHMKLNDAAAYLGVRWPNNLHAKNTNCDMYMLQPDGVLRTAGILRKPL